MSLREQIESSKNDISGSRAKNRLTVQISYAMQLIMEYYSLNYIIMMDYIEDVVVIENPEDPTGIHLYQVKTKSTDKHYTLNTIIKDEWFQKLYRNAQRFAGNVEEAAVVCNTDIVANDAKIFNNERNCLNESKEDSNVKKIVKAIAKDSNISEDEVDLSRFFFVKSSLSTKGHKDEVEYQFESFLLKEDRNLQVATARAIFSIIYDKLDAKFNSELDGNCSDINEIYKTKGLTYNEIKDTIADGLAVQLPDTNRLLDTFRITSAKEIREYTQRYPVIKTDLLSRKSVFLNSKKYIVSVIAESVDNGGKDISDVLDEVYEKCKDSKIIPNVFSEKYYLKMLIMLLAYKYCYGGDSV